VNSFLVLILSRADLEKVLLMEDAMISVEDAFRDLAAGRARMPVRLSMEIPSNHGWFGIMPAYLEGLGSVSTKIVSVFNHNQSKNLPTIMASVILNDHETGELVSVMDGSYITGLRTGALGGIAAKYLSRKDSKTVSIFGAGIQARAHLDSLIHVRNIEKVKVYDPIDERSKKFVDEMSRKLKLPIEIFKEPNEALKDSDIIVTVSTSSKPVFDGHLITKGTHINAFGNFKPAERELDTFTIQTSKIVVDKRDSALSEAGDLIIPIEEGAVNKEIILADLSEVIMGSKVIRSSHDDITLFKSVGLAIQDCAVASLAYRKAREKGIGTTIELS
jgi:alanine dehydrogenase